MAQERTTLDKWGDRVVSQAADQAEAEGAEPGRVNPVDVYGSEQEEDGWRALWETTEVRCPCGTVELVRWRPGRESTRAVECWQCGEVLDLRLERRDREAEQDREDAARERERQVRAGPPRPVVVGSRSRVRAVRSVG